MSLGKSVLTDFYLNVSFLKCFVQSTLNIAIATAIPSAVLISKESRLLPAPNKSVITLTENLPPKAITKLAKNFSVNAGTNASTRANELLLSFLIHRLMQSVFNSRKPF
jgi:hypothetical protein